MAHLLLTFALVVEKRSDSSPGSFIPERNPATQLIGGFVGLSAGLDDLENRKSLFPTGVQTPDRLTRSLATVPTRIPISSTSQIAVCLHYKDQWVKFIV